MVKPRSMVKRKVLTMKRARVIAILLTGVLILIVLFGGPVLLNTSSMCPVVMAQGNACHAQEATNSALQGQIQSLLRTDVAQEAQLARLRSTLSVQEVQSLQVVQTDVARKALILQLRSTLAVAELASTLARMAATTPVPLTTPLPDVEADSGIPMAGEWLHTLEGDCVEGPALTTVALQGEHLIMTNEIASETYTRIAPNVYQFEETTDTYSVTSTFTVINPALMEGETIVISGGQEFVCTIQMTLERAMES
jgi:hypothetical protein